MGQGAVIRREEHRLERLKRFERFYGKGAVVRRERKGLEWFERLLSKKLSHAMQPFKSFKPFKPTPPCTLITAPCPLIYENETQCKYLLYKDLGLTMVLSRDIVKYIRISMKVDTMK